jgi:DNA-binding Lrp family transcriptional regulator
MPLTRLDSIDRLILAELQEDGKMTNVELAKRVGISAPPCLRRVRALEEQGLIAALLDLKYRFSRWLDFSPRRKLI